MTKYIYIIFLFTAFIIKSNAQNFIHISGKVIESNTLESIPFASISIKGTSLGTNTNSEGLFHFNIPFKLKEDTLIISVLGYQSFKCCVKDYKSDSILLAPCTFDLKEFVIKDRRIYKPKELLKKVMKHYKDNYVSKPYIASAFYQEYLEKDSIFTNATEVALKIYNNGDGSNNQLLRTKLEGIRKIKSKNNKIDKSVSMLNFIYGMNWTLNTLFKGNFRNWVLRVDTIKYINNRETYVIKGFCKRNARTKNDSSNNFRVYCNPEMQEAFDMRSDNNKKNAKNISADNSRQVNIYDQANKQLEFVELHIDITDFAITYFNYEWKETKSNLYSRFSTSFEKFNDKYYPKFCQNYDFNNLSISLYNSESFNKIYCIMNINSLETENVAEFRKEDCINIFHLENYTEDLDFWKNYNDIPDDNLRRKIIRDLNR